MSASMPRMTPNQFVAKWKRAELKERSAAQEHFIDLCRLLGEPTPAEADSKGDWYCFERGASKVGGGEGWADVWMREHFGWEYKGKRKDLDAAFMQLQRYAPALENPPLLIVSDLDRIRVHTNWTNTVPVRYEIPLETMAEAASLRILKAVFADPNQLRPKLTTADVTKDAAARFAALAQRFRDRGHEPQRVAHFLNRLMFCLFAEDANLLPAKVLTKALEASRKRPESAEPLLRQLFAAMAAGGHAGFESIDWFNGGLFDNDDSLPLEADDIDDILAAAGLEWAAVEPSIFGTLFERGLDPSKRSQLGAHYTDPTSIMRIITPVIVDPLLAEWEAAKARIAEALAKVNKGKSAATAKKHMGAAQREFQLFMKRLGDYRVLDPACGSGNFLYLALQALKDIEHRAALEAEQLGLGREFTGMNVGVQCLHGIEINSYAAELARVTVWIGEIQWMLRHGVPPSKDPILKPLNTVECRDAILNPDGTEPAWPKVDVIIGNPPFLGDKRMIGSLGEAPVLSLRSCYSGRVPGGADLVAYWFEKAGQSIRDKRAARFGLVATQSIRKGSNREVLLRATTGSVIFDAWADEPWINDGAAVRVSLLCVRSADIEGPVHLNSKPVEKIHLDLTGDAAGAVSLDITKAVRLLNNAGISFIGTQKNGAFEIPGDLARKWLRLPNPHAAPNSDVLHPWANGGDVTKRTSGQWIIDFGVDMPEASASLYEVPFAHVFKLVQPERLGLRRDNHREYWWRHGEARPGMRKALTGHKRFIVTPRVAKHRLFVWLDIAFLPDSRLCVIARSDDVSFGILHSRFHEAWSLRQASMHGVGNDPTYTAQACFETFPFPSGLTPDLPATAYTNQHASAIAEAAGKLNKLRENWLNPPEWVERVPEVVPGYPDRIVAKSGHEAELKMRTLTNLYNENPTWLQNAHAELDEAVAKAYGWTDYTRDMSDDEILARLLALNLTRAHR